MSLFYRETGRGTPVIILHGLYGCSDNWMYIARTLSNKYWVIAVDLRNHGKSPQTNTHTYSQMVTDLAWLFHELEIEKAHVIGHSMGGKLAIAFAADYPEKVITLTVADIAPKNYLKAPASTIQYEMHKRILETLFNLDLSVFSNRNEIEKEIEKTITEPLISGFIMKNLKKSVSGFEWKLNIKVLRDSLDHILSKVEKTDYDDRLPMTNYPVLFIRGGLSGYIGESDIPDILNMYPQAIISTIEGTTHFLHAEKPDEFASVYQNFLAQH